MYFCLRFLELVWMFFEVFFEIFGGVLECFGGFCFSGDDVWLCS